VFVRSSESAGTGTRPFISLAVYDEESSRMQCVSIEELSVVYSSDALRAAAILPVCLSVCLSHSWTVSKWLNLPSNVLPLSYHLVCQISLVFSYQTSW